MAGGLSPGPRKRPSRCAPAGSPSHGGAAARPSGSCPWRRRRDRARRPSLLRCPWRLRERNCLESGRAASLEVRVLSTVVFVPFRLPRRQWGLALSRTVRALLVASGDQGHGQENPRQNTKATRRTDTVLDHLTPHTLRSALAAVAGPMRPNFERRAPRLEIRDTCANSAKS